MKIGTIVTPKTNRGFDQWTLHVVRVEGDSTVVKPNAAYMDNYTFPTLDLQEISEEEEKKRLLQYTADHPPYNKREREPIGPSEPYNKKKAVLGELRAGRTYGWNLASSSGNYQKPEDLQNAAKGAASMFMCSHPETFQRGVWEGYMKRRAGWLKFDMRNCPHPRCEVDGAYHE